MDNCKNCEKLTLDQKFKKMYKQFIKNSPNQVKIKIVEDNSRKYIQSTVYSTMKNSPGSKKNKTTKYNPAKK